MSQRSQSFEHHAKMVPAFHYVGFPILLVLLVWTVVRVARAPSVDSLMAFLLLVVLILAFFFARIFALGVQDRVIRLEERLRMERLLPDDLKGRIMEFTTEQLIGLRFASDEELPELARRVLDEGMKDRKSVKRAVANWKADHQRI